MDACKKDYSISGPIRIGLPPHLGEFPYVFLFSTKNQKVSPLWQGLGARSCLATRILANVVHGHSQAPKHKT